MAFHMPTQNDTYVESQAWQHQSAVPTQTFGLFQVGNQQVNNPPSNVSDGLLCATDSLSSMLAGLALGNATPQVPAQPPQNLAVEQAEQANTQDEFHYDTTYSVEARNYQRSLERFFTKCAQHSFTVEVQRGYPDQH
ncbi:hypothetical protein FS749_002575 [Ceratobasidium sp. UAMH 11750]|nr:hypothetical protein FS749_002575 [Ceratobasidium sp. UAMH 11750]